MTTGSEKQETAISQWTHDIYVDDGSTNPDYDFVCMDCHAQAQAPEDIEHETECQQVNNLNGSESPC